MKPVQQLALAASLAVAGVAHAQSGADIQSPARFGFNAKLGVLLTDMQRYTTDARGHWGNLRMHSTWTANAVLEFWTTPSFTFFQNKLDAEAKKVAVAAALLHDVGKGGDGALQFTNKADHPDVGFAYLTGKSTYKLAGGKAFDVRSVLSLTPEQKTQVAILVGHHYYMGDLRQEFFTADKKPMSPAAIAALTDAEVRARVVGAKKFLTTLKSYAEKAGARLSEALVRLSMVVGAADVRGSSPTCSKQVSALDNCKLFATDWAAAS